MKSQKDFRSNNAANEFVRKAAKLEPIKKNGKEKYIRFNDEEDFDDHQDSIKPKKESVLDYFDDEDKL